MESRAVRKLINHEQGKKRIDNEMERAGGRERERERERERGRVRVRQLS
jgi:hypothetical protein